MRDIHLVRYFSSLITISDGKVIKVTKPAISHCPLAGFFNGGLKESAGFSPTRLKNEIKKVIEGKIARFGFCAKDRMLWKDEAVVPYGASELIFHGLKNNAIDGGVVVCDGAGTVITDIPQVIQGIGAWMHTIFKTSYIPEVAGKLRRYGCHILDKKGRIDQRAGVVEAVKKGYKRIALTLNVFGDESLKDVRALESRHGISIIILAVCTTGIKKRRLIEIEKYADMVWACHSGDIKDQLGKKAIKTLSGASPVYVLTEKGVKLISGYSPNIFELRKKIKGKYEIKNSC